MENFKKLADSMISHNLHWTYGPNQQNNGRVKQSALPEVYIVDYVKVYK